MAEARANIAPSAKYKIVFLGDQSVGKTSIINRFIFDIFDGKNHVILKLVFLSLNLVDI
jgi:Ras-related protein Rab-6A